MRIALITPEWRFENPYPPLGLAYIAATLERDSHKVKIFDLTLENKPFENKIGDIIGFSPDIIGISCMTHNYYNALKVAESLKDDMSIPIIFGGPHPTIMSEDVLKNKFVDFVIMGEGEETFSNICYNLENNNLDKDKRFYNIDGLCFKDHDDKIIVQHRNNFIKDLDTIPFPARHLLDLDKYTLVDDYKNKMVTIMSSRGCPYGCTYCYKGLFGRIYRQRSPDNIIEEIKQCINDFNYRSFYFIDDLFTLNAERVDQFTNKIKEEGLDIRWQCLARVNTASRQMFRQMKETGCYKIHFGIESGSQQILNKVKKGIKTEQIKSAVGYAKDVGIKTKGYFMLGMPGDTIETMQSTLDLAKELQLNDVMFSITTPFPGTELWNNIDKNKISSLSNAFYYMDNDDDTNIFYNLSETTDKDVIRMMKKANNIRYDIKTKAFCNKMFGDRIGYFTWQLSRIPFMKDIGKILIKT